MERTADEPSRSSVTNRPEQPRSTTHKLTDRIPEDVVGGLVLQPDQVMRDLVHRANLSTIQVHFERFSASAFSVTARRMRQIATRPSDSARGEEMSARSDSSKAIAS